MNDLQSYAEYLTRKAELIKSRVSLTEKDKLENLTKVAIYLDIVEDMYRVVLNKQGQQPQVK